MIQSPGLKTRVARYVICALRRPALDNALYLYGTAALRFFRDMDAVNRILKVNRLSITSTTLRAELHNISNLRVSFPVCRFATDAIGYDVKHVFHLHPLSREISVLPISGMLGFS
jgi:hypothetical protein